MTPGQMMDAADAMLSAAGFRFQRDVSRNPCYVCNFERSGGEHLAITLSAYAGSQVFRCCWYYRGLMLPEFQRKLAAQMASVIRACDEFRTSVEDVENLPFIRVCGQNLNRKDAVKVLIRLQQKLGEWPITFLPKERS